MREKMRKKPEILAPASSLEVLKTAVEYGADAIAGIHECVAEMFSEEFQAEFYERQNAEFDKRSFFIGEHVWNFADFATIQGCMRADGNKKGLLTRDRRPKMAAHYFRRRWGQLPNFGYKG